MQRQDFNWSLSRHELFMFCELAYYYQYHASWGGWERHAGPESAGPYRLKNLLDRNSWLQSIVRDSISEVLNISQNEKNSSWSFADALRLVQGRRVSGDLMSMRLQEYRSDQKKVYLDELFYGTGTVNGLKSWIASKLETIVSGADKYSGLTALSEIPLPSRIDTQNPFSFYCDGIKVMTGSDFAFRFEGEVNFVNFYIGGPEENTGSACRNALLKMYALSCFKGIMEKDVRCTSLFFSDTDVFETSSSHPLDEVIQLVKESAAEIRSRLTSAGVAYRENFSRTENDASCGKCRFRALCL